MSVEISLDRVPLSRPRSSLHHGTVNTVRFRATIDGQPPGVAHGIDVDGEGKGAVTQQRLYQLIRQPQPIADRGFGIEFLDAGVEAFDFTFG